MRKKKILRKSVFTRLYLMYPVDHVARMLKIDKKLIRQIARELGIERAKKKTKRGFIVLDDGIFDWAFGKGNMIEVDHEGKTKEVQIDIGNRHGKNVIIWDDVGGGGQGVGDSKACGGEFKDEVGGAGLDKEEAGMEEKGVGNEHEIGGADAENEGGA